MMRYVKGNGVGAEWVQEVGALGGMVVELVEWGGRSGWRGEWVVGCGGRCLWLHHLSSRYGIPG